MKNTLIILTLLLAGLVIVRPAYAYCDLAKVPFGQGVEPLAGKYNPSDPVMASDDGRNMFIASGKSLCSDFAEQSILRVEFIDNRMVQIKIMQNRSDGAVLKAVEDSFGVANNNDSSAYKEGRNFQSVWGDERDFVATYAARTVRGNREEMLIISSKKYKKLFNKQAKENEEVEGE